MEDPTSLLEQEPHAVSAAVKENPVPAGPPESVPKVTPHIKGLDSLRFILAAWVVFSHAGFMPIQRVTAGPQSPLFLRGLFGLAFSGPSAVMAFFVISGFCIHYPSVRGRKLNFLEFYVRRELRILPPLICIFALGWAIHHFEFTTVLWSIVCEEVYYFLYPLLLKVRNRFGWTPLLACSLCASLCYTAFVQAGSGDVREGGWFLPAIWGLPVWLSGAVLAESVPNLFAMKDPAHRIWIWRIAVWACSVVCEYEQYHGRLRFAVTLLVMGAICALWIRQELRYYAHRSAWAWMEKLGAGSYSLYLFHMMVVGVFAGYGISPRSTLLNWSVILVCVAAGSALFCVLIELPSHRLARYAAELLRARKRAIPGAA